MGEALLKLHYDVEAGDYIRGGESSSRLKKTLQQLGVSTSIIKRVCVSCYEAEMNLVIHSYGGFIDVSIFENAIEIYIEDRGPGIEDVELAMKVGYSTASEDARNMGFGAGMGLPNMKKNCDVLKISSHKGDKTIIKMVIGFE